METFGHEGARVRRAAYGKKFVCRVSGLPVSSVWSLGGAELPLLCERIISLEERDARIREDLSARLFFVIGTEENGRRRNALISLRRAVHNRRRFRVDDAGCAAAGLPDDVAGLVRAAHASLEEREALLQSLLELHREVVDLTRARFGNAVSDDDFLKGLALSSRSLFENVGRYQSRKLSGNSRVGQVERGLLRYFTRMATKATPFGRFCAVVGGEWTKTPNASSSLNVRLIGEPRCKRSITRLNKRIAATLWSRLQQCAAVRAELRVDVNPSLRIERDTLVFLTVQARQEVFQRLPRTEAVALVLRVVGGATAPTLAQLADAIADDPECDTDRDTAQHFIDRLIEMGLLRFRAIVADQEADWVPALAGALAGIDDPTARAVHELVLDLQASSQCYASGTSAERTLTLDGMRERLSAAFDALGLPAWSHSDPVLYEDATADARIEVVRSAGVNSALERLAEWIELTLPLAGPQGEMATMRHFFDSFYQTADATGVSLLQFYEDFHREHLKAHLERARRKPGESPVAHGWGNPFDLESIKRTQSATARLADAVRRLWERDPETDELVLHRTDVESALDGLPSADVVSGRSVGVFGQVMDDPVCGTRVVVPGGRYVPGYGKYYSRFLYLLPPEWRASVLAENESVTGALLAEICGDAAFNANLHPPLVPWEISYPTGQHDGSSAQIQTADLEVRADTHDPLALVLLRRGDGRVVWPLDLGFLNLHMRPPLYQLLSRFKPVGSFSLSMPSSPSRPNESGGSPDVSNQTIVCRPRVTYERTVVLARRTWVIPQALFPLQKAGEQDAEYFLKVHRWRRVHGIPEQVFLRVFPLPGGSPANNGEDSETKPNRPGSGDAREQTDTPNRDVDADHAPAGELPLGGDAEGPDEQQVSPKDDNSTPMSRRSRDFRKPQFVDFSNPLLVHLFSRLTVGLERFSVTAEECLPSPQDLPVSGGHPYAVEMIFQVSFPCGRVEAVK